jgi:hypothetical protein
MSVRFHSLTAFLVGAATLAPTLCAAGQTPSPRHAPPASLPAAPRVDGPSIGISQIGPCPGQKPVAPRLSDAWQSGAPSMGFAAVELAEGRVRVLTSDRVTGNGAFVDALLWSDPVLATFAATGTVGNQPAAIPVEEAARAAAAGTGCTQLLLRISPSLLQVALPSDGVGGTRRVTNRAVPAGKGTLDIFLRKDGVPVKGAKVMLRAYVVPGSGGHAHITTTNSYAAAWLSNASKGSPYFVETDESGMAKVVITAGFRGEQDRVEGRVEQILDAKGQALFNATTVTIGMAGGRELVNFWEQPGSGRFSESWPFIHTGQIAGDHVDNGNMQPLAAQRLRDILTYYVRVERERTPKLTAQMLPLELNDMSLPLAGHFREEPRPVRGAGACTGGVKDYLNNESAEHVPAGAAPFTAPDDDPKYKHHSHERGIDADIAPCYAFGKHVPGGFMSGADCKVQLQSAANKYLEVDPFDLQDLIASKDGGVVFYEGDHLHVRLKLDNGALASGSDYDKSFRLRGTDSQGRLVRTDRPRTKDAKHDY